MFLSLPHSRFRACFLSFFGTLSTCPQAQEDLGAEGLLRAAQTGTLTAAEPQPSRGKPPSTAGPVPLATLSSSNLGSRALRSQRPVDEDAASDASGPPVSSGEKKASRGRALLSSIMPTRFKHKHSASRSTASEAPPSEEAAGYTPAASVLPPEVAEACGDGTECWDRDAVAAVTAPWERLRLEVARPSPLSVSSPGASGVLSGADSVASEAAPPAAADLYEVRCCSAQEQRAVHQRLRLASAIVITVFMKCVLVVGDQGRSVSRVPCQRLASAARAPPRAVSTGVLPAQQASIGSETSSMSAPLSHSVTDGGTHL